MKSLNYEILMEFWKLPNYKRINVNKRNWFVNSGSKTFKINEIFWSFQNEKRYLNLTVLHRSNEFVIDPIEKLSQDRFDRFVLVEKNKPKNKTTSYKMRNFSNCYVYTNKKYYRKYGK